jgi:hypothetical protein
VGLTTLQKYWIDEAAALYLVEQENKKDKEGNVEWVGENIL